MSIKIKGIRWLGTRTDKFDEMVKFYGETLGLPMTHKEEGFAAFDMENGNRVEVFSDSYESHRHFTTGPVGGFEVEDIEETKREMEEKGVEFLGGIQGEHGRWAHFRAPDGNIYEITSPSKPGKNN